jgi:hypothetical protein
VEHFLGRNDENVGATIVDHFLGSNDENVESETMYEVLQNVATDGEFPSTGSLKLVVYALT